MQNCVIMSLLLHIITLCVFIIMLLLHIIAIITYYHDYVFETGQLSDVAVCCIFVKAFCLCRMYSDWLHPVDKQSHSSGLNCQSLTNLTRHVKKLLLLQPSADSKPRDASTSSSCKVEKSVISHWSRYITLLQTWNHGWSRRKSFSLHEQHLVAACCCQADKLRMGLDLSLGCNIQFCNVKATMLTLGVNSLGWRYNNVAWSIMRSGRESGQSYCVTYDVVCAAIMSHTSPLKTARMCDGWLCYLSYY